MKTLTTYRELDTWRVAMTMVEEAYRLTSSFPAEERYGLTSQMRRAAVSAASNIAEGQGRGTARWGLHFLRIASGSIAELDTQLEIACRLHYTSQESAAELQSLVDRTRHLVFGMRREHERRLLPGGTAIVSLWLLAVLPLL